MLPQLAQGDANKVFVIPSEFTQAFAGIGDSLSRALPPKPAKPDGRVRRRERLAPRGAPVGRGRSRCASAAPRRRASARAGRLAR